MWPLRARSAGIRGAVRRCQQLLAKRQQSPCDSSQRRTDCRRPVEDIRLPNFME